MSSSLAKILGTGINVFISKSQIITIKTCYEKSIKVSTFVGTVETRTLLSLHGGSLRR